MPTCILEMTRELADLRRVHQARGQLIQQIKQVIDNSIYLDLHPELPGTGYVGGS